MSAALILGLTVAGSTLEAVRLEPTPHGVRVNLQGTDAPNFTAFVESEPFRIVVDWAGSEAGAVDQRNPASHPDLMGIGVAQLRSEGELVTRVTIRMNRKVGYELRAEPTAVWVDLDIDPRSLKMKQDRTARAPSPPAVAAGSPRPAAAGRPLTEPSVEVPHRALAQVEIPDEAPPEIDDIVFAATPATPSTPAPTPAPRPNQGEAESAVEPATSAAATANEAISAAPPLVARSEGAPGPSASDTSAPAPASSEPSSRGAVLARFEPPPAPGASPKVDVAHPPPVAPASTDRVEAAAPASPGPS